MRLVLSFFLCLAWFYIAKIQIIQLSESKRRFFLQKFIFFTCFQHGIYIYNGMQSVMFYVFPLFYAYQTEFLLLLIVAIFFLNTCTFFLLIPRIGDFLVRYLNCKYFSILDQKSPRFLAKNTFDIKMLFCQSFWMLKRCSSIKMDSLSVFLTFL